MSNVIQLYSYTVYIYFLALSLTLNIQRQCKERAGGQSTLSHEARNNLWRPPKGEFSPKNSNFPNLPKP